mgnify:CR=1 FL=1
MYLVSVCATVQYELLLFKLNLVGMIARMLRNAGCLLNVHYLQMSNKNAGDQ